MCIIIFRLKMKGTGQIFMTIIRCHILSKNLLLEIYNFEYRTKMKLKIPQNRNNKKHNSSNLIISLPNRNSNLHSHH